MAAALKTNGLVVMLGFFNKDFYAVPFRGGGRARSVHLLKRRNYRYLFSRKSKMICATK